MPQRSNAFQRMVKRIEQVLHTEDCTIEESAMVSPIDGGDHEEIDILITFQAGPRQYRTGIQAQMRTRDKGGKPWVRSSASQRDQLGLDKMVLVHSRGFTPSASSLANTMGIEIITPHISQRDVESLKPPAVLTACLCEPVHVYFLNAEGPHDAKLDDVFDAGPVGSGLVGDFLAESKSKVETTVISQIRSRYRDMGSKFFIASFDAIWNFPVIYGPLPKGAYQIDAIGVRYVAKVFQQEFQRPHRVGYGVEEVMNLETDDDSSLAGVTLTQPEDGQEGKIVGAFDAEVHPHTIYLGTITFNRPDEALSPQHRQASQL